MTLRLKQEFQPVLNWSTESECILLGNHEIVDPSENTVNIWLMQLVDGEA